MGTPITGMLINTTVAPKAHTMVPFRAAIFYAAGIALAFATFLLVARLGMDNINTNHCDNPCWVPLIMTRTLAQGDLETSFENKQRAFTCQSSTSVYKSTWQHPQHKEVS